MTTSAVFISVVSDEFKTLRTRLHKEIDKTKWKVFDQGNLEEANDSTIRKCDERIRSSNCLVQVLGAMTGQSANQRSLDWLRDRYPNITTIFPELAPFVDRSEHTLSYTQWEAWLAKLHGKNVIVYVASSPTALRESSAAISNEAHLVMLRAYQVYTKPLTRNLVAQIERTLHEFESRTYQPDPINFAKYAETKRAGFVGRDWLFKRLDTWADSAPDQSLLLVGGFGYGKSAIVAELLERWISSGRRVVYHFCLSNQERTLVPGRIVANIAAQLYALIPAYRHLVNTSFALQEKLKRAEQDPLGTMADAVVAPLHTLDHEDPCFIVIDGLDESLELVVDSESGPRITLLDLIGNAVRGAEAAAGPLPSWLRVVMTSRPVDAIRETAIIKRFSVIRLEYADSDEQALDLPLYVRQRAEALPKIAELLARARLAPENFVDALSRAGSAQFLLVKSVLDDVVAKRITSLDGQKLPAGMDEFYQQTVKWRISRAKLDLRLLVNILGLVAVAREPLPVRALASIAGIHPAKVQAIFAAFGGLLVHDSRQGVSFAHTSLGEWLTHSNADLASPGDFEIDRDAATRLLRAHCLVAACGALEDAGECQHYLRGFGLALLLSREERVAHEAGACRTGAREPTGTELNAAVKLLLSIRAEHYAQVHPDRLSLERLQIQSHMVLAVLREFWKRVDDPKMVSGKRRRLEALARMEPADLQALLAEKEYETGLYVPAVRILIECHSAAWNDEIKRMLLDGEGGSDIVFRSDVGVAYAQAWRASATEQKARLMHELSAMAMNVDNDDDREIAGYALKNLCEQYTPASQEWKGSDALVRQLAERYARSTSATDRMVGGEILLALAVHEVDVYTWVVDEPEDDAPFWDPYWLNLRSDVDAINVLLERTTANAAQETAAAISFVEAQEQQRYAQTLRARLHDCAFLDASPLARPVRKLVESFASQQKDDLLFEDDAQAVLEVALKDPANRAAVVDLLRLLALHPSWSFTERATSLARNLIGSDKKRISLIDELATGDVRHWRIVYARIDTAFNCGGLDNYSKFFELLYLHGRHHNCRVRGICADDLDGWIRGATEESVESLLANRQFVDLMRFWVEQADDQWLLEYLHIIFRRLYDEHDVRREELSRLIGPLSPLLPNARFYELSLDDYLEHIESARKAQWLAARDRAGGT